MKKTIRLSQKSFGFFEELRGEDRFGFDTAPNCCSASDGHSTGATPQNISEPNFVLAMAGHLQHTRYLGANPAERGKTLLDSRSVKELAGVVVLAFVMLLFTSIPLQAQQYSVDAASVPQQINQIRLGANLPALGVHPLLQHAAQMHALDMITYGNWSHVGSDGSRVGDRVHRSGYVVDGWTGENWVSAVNSTSALKWWMSSPAHRGNILSSSWQEFGVGSAVDPVSGRTIYVAVFATGRQMIGNAPALASQPPAVPQPAVPQSANVSPNLAIGGPSPRASVSTIKAGDTLFGLAGRFNISWTELASLNGWSQETILQVGAEYLVPAFAYAYLPSDAPARQSINVSVQQQFTQEYFVEPGDTLIGIAENFQIDWQVIAHVNDLISPDMVQIGQRLLLPSTQAPVMQPVQWHVVEPGDTVISVAARYKVGWKTLLQINGLSESTILQIGQELRIENDGDF